MDSTSAQNLSEQSAHQGVLDLGGAQWVVIDTETTGLGNSDRIIEIAAIAVDATSMQVVARYVSLVNPGRDTGAESIHGISDLMVESAPSFREIAAEVADFLHGRVLVAHNLEFDRRFLTNEFEQADIAIDLGRGFCTWRNGTKLTLAASCAKFGISLEGAHRAEADALATATLLSFLDQRHFADVTPVTADKVLSV